MNTMSKQLVEMFVRALVNDAEALTVEESHEGTNSTIQVRVAQADLGRVIGREGQTIRAIRAAVGAAFGGDGTIQVLVDAAE